jgi:hypothetical protein
MEANQVQTLIEKGKQIAARVGHELCVAETSWAHFEALNGSTPDRRVRFHEAANYLGLNLRSLVGIGVRDTILALCRISDPPGKKLDCLTLCYISHLLRNDDIAKERTVSSRNWTPHLYESDPGMADVHEDSCRRDVGFILDHVPARWNEAQSLKCDQFYKFRDKIWEIRDRVLAHAIDAANVEMPEVDLIRHGLKMTSELVRASQRIFEIAAPTNSLNPLIQHANRFWDYAEIGFIEAHTRDLRQRELGKLVKEN